MKYRYTISIYGENNEMRALETDLDITLDDVLDFAFRKGAYHISKNLMAEIGQMLTWGHESLPQKLSELLTEKTCDEFIRFGNMAIKITRCQITEFAFSENYFKIFTTIYTI